MDVARAHGVEAGGALSGDLRHLRAHLVRGPGLGTPPWRAGGPLSRARSALPERGPELLQQRPGGSVSRRHESHADGQGVRERRRPSCPKLVIRTSLQLLGLAPSRLGILRVHVVQKFSWCNRSDPTPIVCCSRAAEAPPICRARDAWASLGRRRSEPDRSNDASRAMTSIRRGRCPRGYAWG